MLLDKVREYIRENDMFHSGDHVVTGVSGGADSLCLLYVLHEIAPEYNLKLTAVHVHHGIRGEEADRDMRHTVDMCRSIGVECRVFHYDVPLLAKEKGATEEEMGRMVRYDTFRKVADEMEADKIAVAHNMGDNCETIIFNLCRGSELRGIAGISAVQGNIVRPLLGISRDEIEEYMKENCIQYIVDSSNLENSYIRNKIRNIVIPYLTENINRQAASHIIAAGEAAKEADNYIESVVSDIFDKYVHIEKNMIIINEKLTDEHPAVAGRIIRRAVKIAAEKLKDISAVHIRSIEQLFHMQVSKSVNLPYNLVAVRTYEGINIMKNSSQNTYRNVCKDLNIESGSIDIDGKIIYTQKHKYQEKNIEIVEKLYTKWFDCDKIENTLQIRNRLPGDYLVVDNKGSRKKLKEYLINEKIPQGERDKLLLLADGHHIIWIVGYRISEYYKVTDNTVNVLEIQIRCK